MRNLYRVLAWLIVALVAVQAAAIAFGMFGVIAWVEEGNELTSSTMQSEDVSFTGLAGLITHGMVGMFVIPGAALLLLIASFFTRTRRATLLAVLIVLDIVLQVAFAFMGFGAPVMGILHGANALVLAGLAVTAARLATPTERTATTAAPAVRTARA